VLFIGNSLTYFNNLPKMLEVIAASQKAGPHIATEAVLKGGERLQGHWEAGNAVAAIRKGGWDYVVLQESSTLGHRVTQGTPTNFDDASAYLAHARRFDEEIRKVGAQTVLYATWASHTQPELQRKLDVAFTSVARELRAAIAPVGLAWTIARLERPDWRLYMSDGGHPTAIGSYLAALTFYTTITGRGYGSWVMDLPASVRGPEWPSGTEVALVEVTWSDKMALSSIAARASLEEPFKVVRTIGSGAPAR
jgi:hypothetical protein